MRLFFQVDMIFMDLLSPNLSHQLRAAAFECLSDDRLLILRRCHFMHTAASHVCITNAVKLVYYRMGDRTDLYLID